MEPILKWRDGLHGCHALVVEDEDKTETLIGLLSPNGEEKWIWRSLTDGMSRELPGDPEEVQTAVLAMMRIPG